MHARTTVLLVEHDAEARGVIAEHLALHGFAVEEAVTGVEAFRALTGQRPDAIVLDLHMPRLGGLEALRSIRALDPSVTVIALAQEADTEVHWRALELGAREALPTPVVLADLVESLESAVLPPRSPAPRGKPGAAPSPTTPTRRVRVLIVTDEPDARAALEGFLSGTGYQVSAVADDVAAVDAIVETPPDVVVLDLGATGAAGTDAVPTIRTLAPRAMVILTVQSGCDAGALEHRGPPWTRGTSRTTGSAGRARPARAAGTSRSDGAPGTGGPPRASGPARSDGTAGATRPSRSSRAGGGPAAGAPFERRYLCPDR